MVRIKFIDKRNLQTMPKIRVDGYYYVLFGKRWQIALYEGGDWYLPGVAGEVEESGFEKIGERAIATLNSLKVVDILNDPSIKRALKPSKRHE